MNWPHGYFYLFEWTLMCTYSILSHIIKRILRVGYLGTGVSLFYNKTMSKLRQNALTEDLTSTQCRDSCLGTNYYDE